MKIRIFVSILTLAAGVAMAQSGAPRDTASTLIAGKKVAIEYGRPSLKGRSFDSLMSQLPSDRVWRAGSEQVTTLTTETDIMIGDKKVPAGKYSLYIHLPESGNPSLLVNSTQGVPLGQIWDQAPDNLKNEPWPHMSYAEIKNQEVARISLEKGSGGNVDMFTIALDSNAMGAELSISWDDRHWIAPVTGGKPEGSHFE